MESLNESSFYTSLDLASAYHQVPLSDKMDSKDKTTFTCFLGTFRFKYLSFGLKNAPACFTRLIETVLAGILYKGCFAYLDDVLVVGKTFEEHLTNLRDVFSRIRRANLKLKLKKCVFTAPEVPYLGHVVSNSGIRVCPEKITKLQDAYPDDRPPSNQTEIKRFLGLVGFYRKFIHNYSDWSRALEEISGKKSIFKWTEQCQKAYITLRDALCMAPVLAYPDFSKPFRIYSDASAVALGSVLCQMNEKNEERPIAYYSRALQPCEKRYENTDRELLAVYESLKAYKPYIWGGSCVCYTDHKALLRLCSNTESPTTRLAK